MRKNLILLGILLAILVVAQIAPAATTYSVLQGFMDNTATPTAWTGVLMAQPGINGWYYRSVGSVDQVNPYPWTADWEATYNWQATLAGYPLCPLQTSPSNPSQQRGWCGITTATGFNEQYGNIGCSDEKCEDVMQTPGLTDATCTTVSFRHGWNSSYFCPLAVEWKAPSAGVASVSLLCYSANGSGTASEFNLGLYDSNGNFVRQLAWCVAVGTTNTGVGHGVPMTASAINVNAGDSIVILQRSAKYATYGTRQLNGAVSGSITLVQNPGTITGTVTAIGGGPVAGVTVTVGASSATTAADGTYSVPADAGTWTVTANKTGFVTGQNNNVTVNSGSTTSGVNFNLTPWGTLTGTVSGPTGLIAGATVTDSSGAYTGTTGTNGVYSISIPAGSYGMTASKPGYNPTTLTVAMTNNATTTQNFTLTSSIISGIITDSIPPNAPIAGVSVWSADGISSAVSDSAGHYNLPVTSGTYVVNYAKTGYAAQSMTIAALTSVTKNISMAQGWDLATDFAAANPNGVWSYGVETSTAAAFALMPNSSAVAGGQMNYWMANGQINNRFMFVKNLGYVGSNDCDAAWNWIWGGNVWHEGRQVIGSPGITWTGMLGTERAIARFSAPSGGNYKVTARFAGMTPAGTTNGVAVRRSEGDHYNYRFGDPATTPQALNGFAGRAANLYADSLGATPVLTYSETMDLVQGQTLDAMLYGMNTGWSQVDLTIAKTSTIIMGRVTSDLPGNPPVISAKVNASSGGNPYTTYTDINGNYVLSVSANDYEITVEKPNYDNGSGIASLSADQVVTKNFTLHHQGKWDVSKDFTFLANPNGQWSYGDLNPVSGYVFTPYDTPTMWSNPAAGTNQPINVWTSTGGSQVGQNLAATPFIWTAWGASATHMYIEPQAVFVMGAWTGSSATSRNHLAAVRWTSPDARIINIHGRFIKSGNNYDQQGSIVKNGNVLLNRVVSGFVGTNAAGYTDSVGVAPIQSFSIVMPVTTGDAFDFVQDLNWQSGYGPSPNWGYNGFPQSNIGLEISVDPGVGTACSSINQVLSQPVGTTVYMLNGVTITADITEYSDYSFYASSDDRSQAIKLIGDATTTMVAEGWKTKFSGTVVVDPADSTRKAVQVTGIYDQVAATAVKPLGISGKALAASPSSRGKWVKVWGKVISKTPNVSTTPPSEFFLDINGVQQRRSPYEYLTIDDGSGVQTKIMTHVQSHSMAEYDYDPAHPNSDVTFFHNILVNDYISVVGIVGTTNGTDFAVMPRLLTDFQHNWIKDGF